MDNRRLKLEVKVECIASVVEYLKTLGKVFDLYIFAKAADCEWVVLYFFLEV